MTERWVLARTSLRFRVALRSHLLTCIEGGTVQKPHDESQRFGASQNRGGYAQWIALGAVAAGSVGAIMGMANCRRSASRTSTMSQGELDPATVTAPHGDKLKGAVV
jgi:hypothetical protein